MNIGIGLGMAIGSYAQGVGNKYCLSFDGVDDYISSDFTSNSGTYTFEMWVKSTQSGISKYLIDNTLRLVFGWNGDVGGNIGFNDGTGWKYFGLAPNDGQWHHLALTLDGISEEAILYVGGNQFGTTKNYTPKNITGQFKIGSNFSGNGSFFLGQIDDVRIWDMVRTQSDIQSNMYKTLSGSESGLVGYWKLNEGSGSVVHDSTSNANDGAIQGASWVVR